MRLYAITPRPGMRRSDNKDQTVLAELLAPEGGLIDRALNLGGAFYLPYRLHARRDQVRAAYPRAEKFAERKRFYDPKLLFRNAMWDAYFS